jgi:hypothetical protein
MPSRETSDRSLIGIDNAYSGGVSTGRNFWYKDFRGIENLISDGHPWPRRRGDNNPDIGGPFQVLRTKVELICPDIEAHYYYGSGPNEKNGWQYTGQVSPASLSQRQSLPINAMDLTAKGATGWARFKPTKPHASLGQFIGELKDLPRLPTLLSLKSRAKFFKSLGHNYLNIEFGWKPFVNDLRRFFTSVRDTDKILRQLARDNGKPVRRSGQISTDTTVNEVSSVGYFTVPSWAGYLYGPQPQKRVIKDSLTTTYRFSGEFCYYIPMGNSPQDTRKREILLSHFLYGAAGTPDVIYELIPWSWAADWISNLGDVISNITDDFLDDGLVANYAYVMGQQTYTQQVIVDGQYLQRTNYYPGSDIVEIRDFTTTLKLTQEIKARSKATPYGFGLSFDGFSLRQLAILASLGFTRMH